MNLRKYLKLTVFAGNGKYGRRGVDSTRPGALSRSKTGVQLRVFDNDDFFGGQRKSRDPLQICQLHGGYHFHPGMRLAADTAYYSGGGTTVDGVTMDGVRQNSRYGVTLSLLLEDGWQTKSVWSRGFATRAGGDFRLFAAVLQYRWFGC